MARVSKVFLIRIYALFLTVLGIATLFIVYAILTTKEAQKVFQHLYDYKDIQRFDPLREGGHLLPNINGWMKGETLDRPVRIVTNSKGFRNSREFDYIVPSRAQRILFLGDSFVDGMRTDQQQTIGYLLEQRLNTDACTDQIDTYEVMISGHNNPANAWYHYQEFGHRYHPQVVILGATLGNDLTWHSYRSTFQPAINSRGKRILVWQTDGLQSKPAQGWFPSEAYIPPERFLLLERIESRLRGYFHSLFPKWGGYLVPAATYPASNDRRHVDMQDFSTSLGLFYQPILPEIEQQFVSFLEVLDGLKESVSDHGGDLAVVLFPTRLQASTEEWDLFRKFYFLDPLKFALSYPNRRIMEYCQTHSLQCTDLLPSFQTHYDTNQGPLYRPHGDMHMSEAGQKLAADELFASVKQLLASRGVLFRPCTQRSPT